MWDDKLSRSTEQEDDVKHLPGSNFPCVEKGCI